MKLNCLIIDDEPIARKLLQEYIEETDFLELVGVAENPLKATGLINELKPDLIFLDINMPKMSGIEFLRSAVNLPMVIMTTAYGQYALDGFELAVIDYLVKPFSLERFLNATQKALKLKSLRDKKQDTTTAAADHFYTKCDGKIVKVIYNDLLYIQAMANYIVFYTITDKLVVYLTIKSVLEKLPPAQFIQVHKSYIVNTGRIDSIEGNMLCLANAKIPMGLTYVDAVMENLLRGHFFKR